MFISLKNDKNKNLQQIFFFLSKCLAKQKKKHKILLIKLEEKLGKIDFIRCIKSYFSMLFFLTLPKIKIK